MTTVIDPKQEVQLASTEQLTGIWKIVLDAVPTRLSASDAAFWIQNPTALFSRIQEVLTPVPMPYAELVNEWEVFYRACSIPGLNMDFSNLKVPARKEDFSRLIVVAPGLYIEDALTLCKKRFPVWRWRTSKIDAITKSVRDASCEPYAVWVRDIRQADEFHRGKSYIELVAEGFKGITLLERLLYELKYYQETSLHLDTTVGTACTGTHYFDRSEVISVGWDDDVLCVSGMSFTESSGGPETAVREVVTV